jgi:putative addiction module component (TIGR02574 family)
MTTEEIISDAMALPLAQRVSLAQALWESIDAELLDADERSAVTEALTRSEDLLSGKVRGETHEEVMEAVRQALKCD